MRKKLKRVLSTILSVMMVAGYSPVTAYADGPGEVELGGGKESISPVVSIDGWTYGEDANAPSVTGNPGEGTVTYQYTGTTNGGEEYDLVDAPSQAGSYTVTATVAETDNYLGNTCTDEFTIARAGITPTVEITGWTYGYYDVNLNSPVVTEGNPGSGNVEYTYYTDSECSLVTTNENAGAEEDGAYPRRVGTYYVKANVAQTDNYEGGVATANFSIARQEVTPVFDAENPEGSNVTFYPPTVPNGTTPIVSMTDNLGNPIPENEFEVYINANTHKVIINDASVAGGNYDIATAILPYPNTAGVAEVRMAPIAATLTYNGEAQVLLGTGNFGTAEHGTMAYALGTNETDAPTGEYTQDATSIVGTDAGDYYVWYKAVGDGVDYLDSTPVCLKVSIAKKTLTVTPNPVSITYGQAPTNDGVSYSGFADGDSEDDGESVNVDGLTFAYTYSAGGNVNAPVNATSRNYTIIPSGLTSSNYAIVYQNGVLTVNKKGIAVSITTSDKVYDGSTTATYQASIVGTDAIVPGDDLRIEEGTATFADRNVGTGKVVTFSGFSLGGNSASNYVLTGVTESATADITPKEVEVTVAVKNKVYDGTNAAEFDHDVTVISGIADGDDLAIIATGTYADANVGEDKAVTITGVTLADGSNGLASNYSLTSFSPTESSGAIVKRPITITADGATKTYDGTALGKNTYTAAYTDDSSKSALGAEDVFDSVTVAGSQVQAGTSPNVPSAAMIKNGSNVDVTSNYDITYANGSLTVTPKALTITADSDTKAYDGTPLTKDSYTNTDLAEGDTIQSVTVTGSQTAVGDGDNVPSAAVIKNSAEDDVTGSYEITYVNGNLSVTGKTITITADSDTKAYDGTPLTKNSYTSTDLAAGDYIESVTVTGSQTSVGSADNVPSGAVIKNASNEDVTDSYTIVYENGTLTVTQKNITITANDASKEYDGTALTKNEYTATALLAGDYIESVTVTGSQIVAGSSNNVPSGAVIKNSSNEDVTSNYNITYANGTLTVTKKALTITADDATKVYDGTALTKTTYTNSDLAEGDTIESVTVSGGQIVAGSGNNVPSGAVIRNGNNDDVTASYEITYTNGTLTVTTKALTITADDDTKTYDGTPLTKGTFTSSGLATGDTITSVSCSGSQTVVGSSDNVPGAAVIKNGDNEDVTASYDITYTNGTLTVTTKALTITADDASKVYDGTPLTKNTFTSSGLATGDTITSVSYAGSQTDVGSSNNVPSGAVIRNGANEDVTASYTISYANGTLTVNKRPVTITANNDTKAYDGTALTNSGCTGSGLLDGHSIASATVTGSQVAVGSSNNVPSDATIQNSAEVDVTGNYDISYANGTLTVTKRALTITAASATKSYDGTALTKNEYTGEGLAEGDSITSVTITGSQTQQGSSSNVPSDAVIQNSAQEDVTGNYEITYTNGTLEVTKKTVTITATSVSKVYDGTELSANSYEGTELLDGDYIESVTVTGSQLNVGSSSNVPSGAVIKNASHEDITENYEITYTNGTLEVTKKALTITADSSNKVYDGTPLSINTYSNTDLATGDSIASVTVTGSQTVAGSGNNVPSAAVIKNSAEEDVTSNYDITYANGNLVVTQKALTITATGATKVYDGTALDNSEVTNSGLATGDTIDSVSFTGSQTNVGSSSIVPTAAVIKNSANVDVTESYNITFENGTLTVNKRPVTITVGSATKVYDGTELKKLDGCTGTGLVNGHSIASVTVTGSQTNVGSSSNVPTAAVIVNGSQEDVTANYQITFENGTLTVNKRPVTITAGSATKVYDGTELKKLDGCTGTGLVNGHSIASVTVTGSQTNVGSSSNVPSAAVIVNGSQEDVTANYQITYANGTLEVTKKSLTITADSTNKVYDGTELKINSYSNTELATGDSIASVSINGSQTVVGSSSNVPSSAVIRNNANADVTSNYEIIYVNGSLTVNKKALTITAGSAFKVYDGTALTKQDGYTVNGLVSGDSVKSVTFTASRTVYGKTPNAPSNPVIENADHENVTGCYEITLVNGELSVTRRPVTITAGSATRVYNGKALTKKDGYTVEGLADGDGISSLTFASSQTVAGTNENTPSNAKIKNSADEDVSSSYAITYVKGTLTVTPKALTITAGSASKVYDGTALTKNTFTGKGLVSGDSITSVTITDSRTIAGTTENTPRSAKIMKGDVDVTSSYAITYVNGTLTILKKPLTITAGSAEKIYDGKALTNNTYTHTDLAQGDRLLQVTINGSQTKKGTCDNEPSAALIYNSDNKNVSDSYDITYVKGALTIIGQARVLTPPQGATQKYNGNALLLLKSAGTAEQGTMQYVIGTDGTTAPTTGWNTTLPTAVKAGTYYVWYKAVGNNDYIDSEPACVTATIKAAISYKVTFKVVNGNWNTGVNSNVVITLSGHEGDTLKLTSSQIPGVALKPNTGYKAGSWDVMPSPNTAITKNTTYTYTYEARTPISAKVTFKVVNGSWGDGTKTDKTITLSGYEGDNLTLKQDQIPSVGNNPIANYKMGSWDVTPVNGKVITKDTTFTYTYVAKTPISAKVTFKVVNGSWNDGTTKDKVVTLNGYEGDLLKLAADQIPAVGSKPGSIYKTGKWDVTPNVAYTISKDITYTYTYAPKKTITSKVTFKVLYGSWDNGKTEDVVVTLTGYEGDTLKLFADQIPAVGSKPGDKYKEGKWSVAPSTDTAITRDTTYIYTYMAKQAISYRVSFIIVNGYADDGRTRNYVITLKGLEGDTLKLPADQIPSVGKNPLANYKKGSWDVTPVKDTVITKDTTYTYTYVEKDKISATVTFKVVNGFWNDGTSTDKVVTLSGYEGTILKLMNYQIPAVGNKAKDQSFKAGSWDVVPDTTTQFTKNVTYTYTYAAKTPISAKVTYKVVNGSWDDGKSKDVVVTLKGYEGDILRLSVDQIPEVGNKPAFAYKAGKWDVVPRAYTIIDKDTTYTYTYDPKKEVEWNVTFKVLNGTWNNGSSDDVSVTLKGYEGDTLKLIKDQIPTVGDKPADRYKEGVWNFIPDTETAITRNMTYIYTYRAKSSVVSNITFKVVNGTWNDGTNKDISVVLRGLEDDPLQLSADQIPRVGGRPDDLFTTGSWDVVPDIKTCHEGNVVYTYTYAPKEAVKVKVTFKVENGTWNDGTKDDVIVTLEGYKGDEVKLTSDQIPTYGLKPAEGFKPGSWDILPYITVVLEKDLTFTYSYIDQNTVLPDDDGGVYIVTEKNEKNFGQSALDNTAAEVKKTILTNEDVVQIYEGKDVKVWIEIKDRTEDVKEDEQELVENKVKEELGEDYVIACYLNVNLWKQVTGEFPQLVKEVPNGKVKISMILPENLRKAGRTFKVARIHGDEAAILDADLAEETNRLSFESDAFSIYALVYHEPKSEKPKEKKDPVTEVFLDIDPNAWYVEATQYVYDCEIMFGKGNTTFAPTAVITREEVVQTLNNHMGQPTVEGENPFSDVVKGAWYYDAVLWGNAKGVAVGFGDGIFGIGKTITREQLAQMLYNYATYNGYDLTLEKDAHKGYADSKNVSGWAVTAMDWAISQGIMSGKGAADAPKDKIKLDPLAGATRAECASMIMKIDQKNKK